MFTFNLQSLLPKKIKTIDFKLQNNSNGKQIEHFRIPSPCQIRKSLEKLHRCPKCHFLIFDNYFSDELENISSKVCPTCGYKL